MKSFITLSVTALLCLFSISSSFSQTNLWKYEATAVINSTVAASQEGTLYFGSDDDRLHAVTPTGVRLWRIPVGRVQVAPSVADDGTIIVGTTYQNVTAVRPDGTVRWEFQTGGGVLSSPAIAGDGTIYIGSDDRKLYALTPNGEKKWDYETGHYIRSSPAIASDGTIYFGSLDRYLYALRPDGSLKWRVITGGEIHSSPAIGSDGTIYFSSHDGRMYAFSPEGIEKWQLTNAGGSSSPVVGDDGTIYAGSGFAVIAISPQGMERWRFQTSDQVFSTPAVGADGTIYVGSNDRKIYALNPNGTKKWEYETGNVVQTCSPTIFNGRMYVGSADGFLHAFQIGAGPANSSWPMFHREPRHQGRAPASGPPVILDQPKETIVPVNSNIVLRASATGSEPLSFQWQFNGQTLVDGARVSGAKTGTLVVNNAQVEDSGDYLVVITNGLGSIASRAAAVSVRANFIPPGTKLWEFALSNVVNSSPAQAPDGAIYIGSDSGFLHAVNPDGSAKWAYRAGSQIWGSPTVGPDGTVFFGAMFPSNAFYAVNQNGTLRWRHPVEGNVPFTPAIGQSNEVYFTSTDGNLAAFTAAGQKLWDFFVGTPYQSSPVVDRNGTIYVAGTRSDIPIDGSTFYAIRPDGTLLWRFSSRGPFMASPALTEDGRIYLPSGFNEGKLFCLDMNGNLLWEHATGAALFNAPVIGPDGTIYLAHNDQVFFAINPDGTRKWRFDAQGSTRASAAVSADGNIYFGAMDGNLYSLNSSGRTNWHFPTEWMQNGMTAPLITESGAVIFGAAAKLLAVQGSDTLATSDWPMFNRDRQHNGRQPTSGLPSVRISKPGVLAMPEGIPVVVEAIALGGQGGVRDVKFLIGTNQVIADDRIPFSITLTNMAPGFYDLAAAATDFAGNSTTSSVSLLVINSKPQVEITAPTNGAVFPEGSTVTLQAGTVDPVGPVMRVEFLTTDAYLGLDTSGPFEVLWTPSTPGTYSIFARATDQFAERADSQPITVTINGRPAIDFSSPAAGARFFLGETIQIRANVPDPERDIASVRFIADGQLLATDTTAPYEFAWTSATVGTHRLEAIVGDNLGLTNSATLQDIRVDTRLGVVLSSPPADAVFFRPTNVFLSATITAPDAPVQRVEFRNGNTVLGVRTSEPFSLVWTNPPIGRHLLSVFAQDTLGTSVSSSPSPITVHSETSVLAANDNYSVDEDGLLEVSASGVLTNDVNLNAEPLSAILVQSSNRGTLTFNTNGAFVYRPNTNFHGVDTFTYRAAAGARASESAGLVTITVRSVNDRPVAESKTVLMTEDQEISIALNAFDVETNDFRFEMIRPPLWGRAFLASVQSASPYHPSYRPDPPHFYGEDSFVYRVFDGMDYSEPATVRLIIQPVEDPPIASSENYFARLNEPLQVTSEQGVLANDFDPEGAKLTASVVSDPKSGTLSLQSNGGFLYAPNAGFIGADQFSYRASDGTNHSDAITVPVSVGDERWRRFPNSVLAFYPSAMVTGADGKLYATGPASGVSLNEGPQARGIAVWDGQSWDKLGNGPENGISGNGHAVAVFGTNLVVGGEFHFAGGRPARGVALWNGNQWRNLGIGMDGPVLALAATETNIFAGGRFLRADGAISSNVARWNGSEWLPLGAGLNGHVNALALLSDGSLVAGGSFTNGAIRNIARWNGSAWQALQQGIGGEVFALAAQGNQFYAAGKFDSAGGLSTRNVAFWNGSQWVQRGSGIGSETIPALAWEGTNVYAGESLDRDAAASIFVYRWDGSDWRSLPEVLANDRYPQVRALKLWRGQLFAGGNFNKAGSVSAERIARWDGQNWGPLHNALGDGQVKAITGNSTNVFVAGTFRSAGKIEAERIALWDEAKGGSWQALGAGLNGPVNALALAPDGVLYAGGEFTQAGGIAARHVARWDGRQWSALGAGFNRPVQALEIGPDGHVYAGGDFTASGSSSMRSLARWNGQSWSQVGGGVNGWVVALKFSGPDLYAGGEFTSAGGAPLNNIGVWNGSSWRALGEGFPLNSVVRALAVRNHEVFAGGDRVLHQWDGAAWRAIAGEAAEAGYFERVEEMQIVGDRLFVGGRFWGIGSLMTRGVAEWDGTNWTALGSGIGGDQDEVYSIFRRGRSLFIGGNFQQAARRSSNGFAQWQLTNSPPEVQLILPDGPFVTGSNIQLDVVVSDEDGTIEKVEFFEGSNLIGVDFQEPFSVTWSNVFTGGYRLLARATDNSGAPALSENRIVSVSPPANNVPPTVRFEAPAPGSVLPTGQPVRLEATASDSDGSIRQITFLDGTTVIGTITQAPFEIEWRSAIAGEHRLQAIAMDNLGSTVTSEIIVRLQTPPEIYISSPRHGDIFEGPRNILLDADARDDNAVTNVDFFVNGSLLGRYHYASTPNYYFVWTNAPPGTYTIAAKAYDNEGGFSLSSNIVIAVATTNVLPTIRILSPTAQSGFTAPTSINITVATADADGQISAVEYFASGNFIGRVTAPPFNLDWRNLSEGNFCISAVALDNRNGRTRSSDVCISITNNAAALPKYRFVDIGLAHLRRENFVSAINSKGVAAGWARNAQANTFPYRFTNETVVFVTQNPAEMGIATAINSAGEVAGVIGSEAFVTRSNAIVRLGSLGGPSGSSVARGLNDTGRVVGDTSMGDGTRHAFLYDATRMIDLGTLGGGESSAYAINSRGIVAGIAQGANAAFAFIWDRTNAMRALPTLGGNSIGYAINDVGQVAGSSADAHGNMRPTVMTPEVIVDLGTLPGHSSGAAYGINNRGQIVGKIGDGSNSRAFLWQNCVMYDLNRFVPEDSDWVLTEATAINEYGWIVGHGRKGFTIQERQSFLLIPEDSGPTLPFSPDAGFQLCLPVPLDRTYVLQTSTDLINWLPLSTNHTQTGIIQFLDRSASGLNRRFYRLR